MARWVQKRTNPSSFYGIKVWAKVSLPPNDPFGVLDVWMGPIYLRIHHSHALSISATSGGNTEPYPGAYHYYEGTSVTVTAYAYSGYTFNYWLLDGVKCGSDLTITVTMNCDHTLEAYFNAPPNTPSKPSGPTSGVVGTSYTYSTSTTDPDGDNVCYQFD
jgi:hypothetical protein